MKLSLARLAIGALALAAALPLPASAAEPSKVSALLDLARRPGLATVMLPHRARADRLDVVVAFARAPSEREIAALRAEGVELGAPLVTGSHRARVSASGLAALEKSEIVRRVESEAPFMRPADAAMLEENGTGPLTRAALGEAGIWLDGHGVTLGSADADAFVFHPSLFRADAGAFAWIDVDGDGAFRPGVDAVDLDRDGKVGDGEVAQAITVEMRDLRFAEFDPHTEFDATLDYVFLDANGNARRDYGKGFAEDTPAYGEPIFVADDANGNGKLDPTERLLRLGTSKFSKINAAGIIYERGDREGAGIIDYGVGLLANLGRARSPEHGTYMSAIMVGGNGSNRFRGVAPGADLELATQPTFDALDWLATEPIVAVSMPFGSVFGTLDGTSELEALADAFWQRGILASAVAGNSAGSGSHAEITIAPGEERSLVFTPAGGGVAEAYVNALVHAPGASVKVSFFDTSGGAIGAETAVQSSPRGTTATLSVLGGSAPIGRTTIKLALEGATQPQKVHVYTMGARGEPLPFAEGAADSSTVGSPATADSNFVGTGYVLHSGASYGTTAPAGELAPFASRGPRVDGTALVGIAAPVNPIAATIVSSALDRVAMRAWPGTSCSSPQIAAAAALLKQRSPKLTASAIRDRMIASARRDAQVTSDPNVWGAGKLDVREAAGLAPRSSPPPVVAVRALPRTSRDDLLTLHVDVTSGSGDRLSARWDTDYDGSWDTDWATLGDLTVPATEGPFAVRVAVHDEAGNVAGATAVIDVPAPPPPSEASTGEGGCAVRPSSPGRTGVHAAAVLAVAILTLARRPRRRRA